ncbi:Cro/Cl family transcriptional regulator, partial [Escherichia coli]
LSTSLTKIYYNYAVFLKEQQEDCLALKVTNEGISLAREKNSLYFLEELFELKGHLLYRLKEENAAEKSFQLYRA